LHRTGWLQARPRGRAALFIAPITSITRIPTPDISGIPGLFAALIGAALFAIAGPILAVVRAIWAIRSFWIAIWAASGADLALLMTRLVGLTPGGAARISVARAG
jgi:uncharacterized membrane protein YvlD (DUF360 family)